MERALSKPRILQSVLENESAYEPEEIMLLGKKEVIVLWTHRMTD